MFKNIIYLIALIIIALSCDELDSNKDKNKPIESMFFLPDSSDAIALFITNNYRHYFMDNEIDSIQFLSSVEAYLSDGYELINVSNVKFDNQSLNLEPGEPGIYTGYFDFPSSNPYILEWEIIDYLDSNYNYDQYLLKPISFSNIFTVDTISISSGFTLHYDADLTIDTITLDIIFDSILTNELVGNDSLNVTNTRLVKFVPNSGSLVLDNFLNQLTPNRFYTLGLFYTKYHENTYKNEKIAHLSQNFSSIVIYLIN